MGKAAHIVGHAIQALIGLGILGVSIAILIFVLQDHNARLDSESLSTTPKPSNDFNIPDNAPIAKNNSKFSTYNSFSDLLSGWMNKKIDPCTDFYQFTCGSGNGLPMSFDKSDDDNIALMAGTFRTAAYFEKAALPMKQMKIYFDKCVTANLTDEQKVARSKRILDDVLKVTGASFPLLFQTQSVKDPLSANALALLIGYQGGKNGVQTLVQVGVDTNWKDPHNSAQGYSLQVDQPATMYRDTYYRKVWEGADGYRVKTINAVIKTMNVIAKQYGITLTQSTLQTDAMNIADLDYKLAMYYSSSEIVRRNYERSYNPMDVVDLQSLYPFINWKSFLTLTLRPVTDSFAVDETTRTIVIEISMLDKLNREIRNGAIDAQTLSNYIIYMQARSLEWPKPKTVEGLRSRTMVEEEKEDWDAAYEGRRRRRVRRSPRDRRPGPVLSLSDSSPTEAETKCISSTMDTFVWANSRLFADTAYSKPQDKENIRAGVNAVVRAILMGFRGQLDILDWMSTSTKRGAYNKIDSLVVNIAFPDWVLDDGQLSDYYKKLDIVDTDDYLTVVDKLNAFNLYESFRPLVLGRAADRRDFSSVASTTNAWYQPEMNSITFPGGILHAPFYDPNYPAAINFGSMGVIAGHELTHGFDDEGVQWDGTGVLQSWMDSSSATSFKAMAQCVVDEYSGFCPESLGNKTCVAGDQTQGENIADNGGIQAAYKAFKAYEALNGPDPLLPGEAAAFTPDQLFFMAFAQVWCQSPPEDDKLLHQILTDVHSPSLYRVFGTVQNIPAFQKAFNCPVDSPYAPVKHCNVWTSKTTSGNPLDTAGIPIVKKNDINVVAPEQIKPKDLTVYNAYTEGLDLLSVNMNLTMDPCDDFYKYSCGSFPGEKNTFYDMDDNNYKKIRDKLEDTSYQGTLQSSEALKKVQALYKACLVEQNSPTTNTIDYVYKYVARLQHFLYVDIPLMGGTGVEFDDKKLASALGYLSFELAIDTFVSPLVDTYWHKPQNNDKGYGNQLFVDQMTGRYQRPYYEDDAWKLTKPSYYADTMALLQNYAMFENTTLAADFEKQLEEALEFERMLIINFTATDDQRRRYERQWNEVNLNNATNPVLGIDWPSYFLMAPNIEVEHAAYGNPRNWYKNRTVVFNELDSTRDLLSYISDKSMKPTVANYLFLRVLFKFAGRVPCLAVPCKKAQMNFMKRELPSSHGKRRIPRFEEPFIGDASDPFSLGCAQATSALPDAQGRIYIDARFPTEDDRTTVRKSMHGVIKNVVDGMKAMLQQLDWMDPVSKKLAIDKADGIVINVAYPDFITNNTLLDASYLDLKFDDSVYYNMIDAITPFNIRTTYTQLTKAQAKRDDFLGQTAVVNAWYQPELNSITFPAGILQGPYFNPSYPAGMNYGGIGVVAGHELTHGFDDEGIQWGPQGELSNWMNNANTTAGFNTMAECVIEEYNTFCPLDSSFAPNCTNGVRTQGENIADNGGIHSAWRAYSAHVELNGPDPAFSDRVLSQYTENQLYFLNFAQVWCMAPKELTNDFIYNRLMTDPHSLGPFRVLGTLQNIPAFRAAFNCPSDSTYAPSTHCNVWVPNSMA